MVWLKNVDACIIVTRASSGRKVQSFRPNRKWKEVFSTTDVAWAPRLIEELNRMLWPQTPLTNGRGMPFQEKEMAHLASQSVSDHLALVLGL